MENVTRNRLLRNKVDDTNRRNFLDYKDLVRVITLNLHRKKHNKLKNFYEGRKGNKSMGHVKTERPAGENRGITAKANHQGYN